MVIVLSGPGGVGKGTLAGLLVESEPTVRLSRSWTTRAPRVGEAPDAYVFVDRAAFEAHLAAGGFLEWNDFHGNLYGTPVPELSGDHDLLLEIDVNGARQVRDRVRDPLLIYVDAPDREEQRRRLVGRGDPTAAVEARIAEAGRESEAAAALGCHVVVNDDLGRALAEIRALIASHRT
jgi:guanylate kinase